jgi:hypothetical protein
MFNPKTEPAFSSFKVVPPLCLFPLRICLFGLLKASTHGTWDLALREIQSAGRQRLGAYEQAPTK